MSELITTQSMRAIALPAPRVAISIRVATLDDLAFIDSLQKKTSKMVGFMPTKQIEGKIAAGHVLVAESFSPRSHGDTEGKQEAGVNSSSVAPCLRGERIGYLIGCDRYFKHDDVGIIYAINVVPEMRRSLVAASLLKAQFERSAYGCRLYCCWCAQDLEANRFWESMGFTALAFRTGSPTRGSKGSPRVHIFWQKRIRAGDTGDPARGGTPWWFPSQTTGGSIREDRIVLPMRPGMHWSEAQPIVLPGEVGSRQSAVGSNAKKLPSPRNVSAQPTAHSPLHTVKRSRVIGGGLRFGPATPAIAAPSIVKAEPKPKRVKQKNDPALVAAARELRDRWLEEVNASPMAAIAGKYDVSRSIESRTTKRVTADVVARKLIAA